MTVRTYHGLTLDPFQAAALDAVDEGRSVIVAAPTGTGKTLVADYLIEKAMHKGLRIIYTAPIKALSNQKYKDFKEQFGSEAVGILTGDVVLNSTAPLIIMTTEIFRNQVITEDPNLAAVSYVIFDEIHWLNDEDRGTVWEESLILAPLHIKVLGLSATIANAHHLTDWIKRIRQDEVALIEEQKRAVPLQYMFFTKDTGPVPSDKLWKYYNKQLKVDNEHFFSPSTHLDLIKVIQKDYLPALYFVFSRRQCVEKARELSVIANYLRPLQRRQVEEAFLAQFGPEEEWSVSTRLLHRLCVKGIAYHHAGLLPLQKSIVEELFQERLIQVLYCTETFSVGINYPVRSVCFDSLHKFDGKGFRPLANHEFFQMSGRAGRRGIDEQGYSFALIDLNRMEKDPPPHFEINRLEPLTSQFKLSYNTVLNLAATLNQDQIKIYFQKSFAAYSYQLSSEQLRQELTTINAQLTTVNGEVCERIGSFQCPLKYFPKQKELERLQRVYANLGPRRQRKVYGRQISRKISAWEALLAERPHNCPAERQATCRSRSKDYYVLQQKQRELEKELRALPAEDAFLAEFALKKQHLQQMAYMRGDQLLPRGTVASRIYVQELLVTELIFSDVFAQLDDDHLNALLACIDFESRRNDYFQRQDVLDWTAVTPIIRYVQSICGVDAVRCEPRVAPVAFAWSKGQPLTEIEQLCNLDEGDIISVFRRTIDLLRQMREAMSDPLLKIRLKTCMDKLDRDEAAVQEI